VRFRNGVATVTGSYESARDAVQEGFARALRARGQYRGDGSLEGWVWRIVLRAALELRDETGELPIETLESGFVEPERDPALVGDRGEPRHRRLHSPTMAPVAAATALAAAAALSGGGWRSESALPVARGEVAAASVGGEIAIVGGFLADGSSSPRVDAYASVTGRWRPLPDLPRAANHAFAAGWRGRLYVAGGYGDTGRLRAAWVLDAGAWRPLPPLPYGLAAGGGAVIDGTLYLVGGVAGPADRPVLVRRALALDLDRPDRWRSAPGPTSREHLAVVAAGGRLYAIGGRTAGFDTNTRLVETWRPGEPGWRRLAPLPEARGGTGAAVVHDKIVSVGGEAPAGTIASVYAYDLARARWRRLPDLPTPRHGLAVAALGGRIYAVAGGRTPGLAVSDVNESLAPG
jgi:N-acetylneuraminic acid mutarotase